ncbi:acyl-CoA thioesterase [Naumannella halotolerans]|uniref:Acyl-CoA thioester hydrolase n=1 Tax=Naumannella halotolerans TaxID=993414 RepID=A0A4R7J948_9ACTN|nr:thioesterase family protein [Naumannella halotolerans]TDT34042.1 acyl-CoA thioester hydrolase [Naumannella halotolerans]
MPRFAVEVPLRWGDLDAYGHVNNGAYVDCLQEARVALLLRGPDGTGPVSELLGGGVIVAEHQVEHRYSITDTSAPVEAELWVEQLGAARFSLGYVLRSGGREALVARTVACPYDFTAGRVRRLTGTERDFFASVREEVRADLRTLPKVSVEKASEVAEWPLSVRWSDLDSYGHVNNVRFFDYLQEARVRFLDDHLLLIDAHWVVARQDVKYVDQITHRLQPYRVRTTVAEVGRSSVQLAAEIDDPDTGRVFATANTVLVAVDPEGRPVPINPS